MIRFGLERVSVGERLRDITLDVPIGAVTAVVGGDGAGKTTLCHLLVGTIGPDEGTVSAPDARRIGFVPTGSGSYADLTVDENLRFVATAYRLGHEEFRRRRAVVLELTGLGSVTERLAAQLSGGMRHKLALALGTLHGPQLLVLDEPTTGVDPVSRADLWRIIANAAAEDAHVIVATSTIDEAERAINVLALHDGAALLEGPPSELASSTPGVLLDVARPSERELAWRHGSRWRQWVPGGRREPHQVTVTPGLEDAVIVATLDRERRAT